MNSLNIKETTKKSNYRNRFKCFCLLACYKSSVSELKKNLGSLRWNSLSFLSVFFCNLPGVDFRKSPSFIKTLSQNLSFIIYYYRMQAVPVGQGIIFYCDYLCRKGLQEPPNVVKNNRPSRKCLHRLVNISE